MQHQTGKKKVNNDKINYGINGKRGWMTRDDWRKSIDKGKDLIGWGGGRGGGGGGGGEESCKAGVLS